MTRGGKANRRRWYLGCLIILITVGVLLPAPTPALALNTDLAIGCTILGLLATPLIAYGLWENLPQNQGKERLIKGEFYVGGFMGAALTPSQDLKYSDGFSLNKVGGQGPATLFGNKFQPGVVGGLKFGYFNDRIPYLGLEVETYFNRSAVRSTTLSTSRPILGSTTVTVPNDDWVNWTTALHIVGRYGFLPDQEVPFGRLQPYVGLGPAFVVNYEEEDSAKNFGVDVMVGLRYMMLKNVSAFVEYKFNYLWNIEIEDHAFYLPNGTVGRGTAYLNYDSHKIVLGVAYHF
ncbi:MAG: outer membrane beta-barrel protein [Desulfobaccales bacterium]